VATALIADDEPLLRERLVSCLSRLWPELQVVAQARNGHEAVELFEEHSPKIVFLDVHMPGMNGVEAARCIGRRAEVVFVTAFENYAVEAFRQGAIDYVIKPFDEVRLGDTVQRLQTRLAQPAPEVLDTNLDAVLERIAGDLRQRLEPKRRLGFIKASVGNSVRMIPVDEILYFRSDTKYTLVMWPGGEALIRKTIRELTDELDPDKFTQIHRSVIVNLHQVSHIHHSGNETLELHLKGRPEKLPVSRSYLHLFRQM
jgi:DNA-binding LytR/AlgR family response regulator